MRTQSKKVSKRGRWGDTGKNGRSGVRTLWICLATRSAELLLLIFLSCCEGQWPHKKSCDPPSHHSPWGGQSGDAVAGLQACQGKDGYKWFRAWTHLSRPHCPVDLAGAFPGSLQVLSLIQIYFHLIQRLQTVHLWCTSVTKRILQCVYNSISLQIIYELKSTKSQCRPGSGQLY